MKEKPYQFTVSKQAYRYEFLSISAVKEVRKVVLFTETGSSDLYNLALLDLLDDGTLCDVNETKNKDFKTVLATVIHIIHHFLTNRPSCYISFLGSDPRRHRLYRVIIGRELDVISKTFTVWGVTDDSIELFEPSKSYIYYLIGNI